MTISLLPGDIGFAHQTDFVSWWIRFAQHHKYGKTAYEAQWNHAFIIIDPDGTIIEADPTGLALGNIAEYTAVAGNTVAVFRPPYTAGNNLVAVAAEQELLGEKDKYGYLALASVALSLMTGTRLRIGIEGTDICSGAVSYALTRANIDVGQDAEWNTPADLVHYAIIQHWLRLIN